MIPDDQRRMLEEKLESLGLHLDETIELMRQARSHGDEESIETAKVELKKILAESGIGRDLAGQIRTLFSEAGIEL